MPDINMKGLPDRVLPIIYVIDVSGSMMGERIAAVNEAMYESMNILREASENNADADVRIGVLVFSDRPRWVTKTGLASLEDFYWPDLQAAGATFWSGMINDLNNAMSGTHLFPAYERYYAPIILFISDGVPGDVYENNLYQIERENKWFKESTRICIAITEEHIECKDSLVECLSDFAGDKGIVIGVNQPSFLTTFIQKISLSAVETINKAKVDSIYGGYYKDISKEIFANALVHMDCSYEYLINGHGISGISLVKEGKIRMDNFVPDIRSEYNKQSNHIENDTYEEDIWE